MFFCRALTCSVLISVAALVVEPTRADNGYLALVERRNELLTREATLLKNRQETIADIRDYQAKLGGAFSRLQGLEQDLKEVDLDLKDLRTQM